MATRNLKKGCTGNDVKTLQKKLKKLGYYTGSIDGSFGSLTDAAVRKFQKACKLTVDGIVGPKTRAALAGKTKKSTGKTVKKGGGSGKSGGGKSKNKNTTHNIGKWNKHKFVVSAKVIRGFTGLQIKGSSELEDKKKSGQGKVKRKGGNPTEVSLTVNLNAFVGNDVRSEAMKFIKEARAGKKAYFYINSKKLVSCKLMLTEATVKDVEISIGGKWTSANVQLTMKQCNKGGKGSSGSSGSGNSSGGSPSGSSGGGGNSGSNKVSVRTSSPVTNTSTKIAGKAGEFAKKSNGGVDAVSSAAPTAASVKKQTGAVARISANAKKVTAIAKTVTVVKPNAGKDSILRTK